MGTAKTVGTSGNLSPAKIQTFQGKVLEDLAAASTVACAYIGDRLGLYKAMAKLGPVTATELAKQTSTHTRYIQEWLLNQAASGYVEYDSNTSKFSLAAEHAEVLAEELSQFFMGGGFQTNVALTHAAPRMVECFKSGGGLSWGDQSPDLFEGTERFFRPAYIGQLIQSWIPALKGMKEKLEAGAVVADVGCGHGVSTILMAKAFPNSRFYGFDNHGESIEHAQEEAKREGLSDRLIFSQCSSNEIPDNQYDLIAFFDCLHDMGDPVAACKSAASALKKDGSVMIVEPMAGRHLEDNFNVVGRAFSGASVLCCTPNAIAAGGPALGTVATDEALEAVAKAGGLTKFHRAIATPFNRVFEARKD